MKSSSSEIIPDMLPSSLTPISNFPPWVLAKEANERAILAASLTSNLKSRCKPSPFSIRPTILCFFTIVLTKCRLLFNY